LARVVTLVLDLQHPIENRSKIDTSPQRQTDRPVHQDARLKNSPLYKFFFTFLSRYIRLVTTDEDNKRLKTELSEMKARHRLEIERVTREKEQEMDEVHKRFVRDDLLV